MIMTTESYDILLIYLMASFVIHWILMRIWDPFDWNLRPLSNCGLFLLSPLTWPISAYRILLPATRRSRRNCQ